MWSRYLSLILVLWFWHYMISRTTFLEVCGLTLPLVMLRGRSLSKGRGQLMWVLSVLPVRGLLNVISLTHSFPRLIILIRLSSSGHGRLARLMIRHTSLRHWLYLTMPLRASRGPLFHTRPWDSHATLCSSPRDPRLHTLGLELSRPLLHLL